MTVQLYLCEVSPEDAPRLPALLARLDAAERDRAARFAVEPARLAYAAAHALLRHALDRGAGRAGAWAFAVNGYGKPSLDPPLDDIRFNLSHTDRLVAVAVARGLDVGVDVEAALRAPDEATFEGMVLAPEEAAELAGCADRPARLMRLWVAKEAVAKAIGMGLSLPPREIVLEGAEPRLAALPEAHGPASEWWLHTESLPGHWLALAARSAPRPIAREQLTVARLLES
ncbi:MAG TPA: 4'-phosphopantetheinyl transferase superfamily protein [Allosphingosinicella sp.]|jgi:4'-phosphopantetheinyl transferase